MPNGSLMEMMGYEAPDLPTMFGQYFEDVDPRWTQMFAEPFEAARTALGELPGLRGGMLGQLRGGLQERGVAAGRALEARRAGAGFAGAGAIERVGRMGRRGLEREYGRGMYGIEQDIARKRAGVLGGLRGQIGGFLERLLAADVGQPGDGLPSGAGVPYYPETFGGGIPTGGFGLPGPYADDVYTGPVSDARTIFGEEEEEDFRIGFGGF